MIDRDELLCQIDLAALLDELSPAPATRLGRNARWRCIDPKHEDQHPSITMFTDRRGIQRWKCWSGGHGGTAIDAILVARRGTLTDALADLQRRTGSAPGITRARPVTRQSRAIAEPTGPPDPAMLQYVAACQRILWQPAGRRVLDYLINERGLAPDVLKANQIGADPGPNQLRRAFGMAHGGIAAVLPTLDFNGNVTYVQARYLDKVDGRPKYDNPASRIAANPRISWVNRATATDSNHLVVCEGVIDALSVASLGTPAVAVLGATYVDQQIARAVASRAAGRLILVAFDGDNAGRKASETFTASLQSAGYPSRVLALPDGSDINSEVGRDNRWIVHQQFPKTSERGAGHRDPGLTIPTR